MFSKKLVIVFGLAVLLLVSLVVFSVTNQRQGGAAGGGSAVIFVVAPVQDAFVSTIRFTRSIWRHYFFLISTAKKSELMQKQLREVISENERYKEVLLANQRLRRFLDFHKKIEMETFAAEVVARDPSAWFKSLIIDKGSADGVQLSMPVVVPEGVVGQVVEVSLNYSKVLLIVDPNSAVDALCQRTRARGIVKGGINKKCDFEYVLRKRDVSVDDVVVSSGLDGVYPKGIRIGQVGSVVKRNSGIFQKVEIYPSVNFDKLEEVLVITNVEHHQMTGRK